MRNGLILTRKQGESIIIGDDIIVTIDEVNGKQVRLKIIAPPSVPVDRMEIRHRKNANKEKP